MDIPLDAATKAKVKKQVASLYGLPSYLLLLCKIAVQSNLSVRPASNKCLDLPEELLVLCNVFSFCRWSSISVTAMLPETSSSWRGSVPILR